jgi:cell division protein FtsQ
MKEQVIASRGTRRTAAATKGYVQRPKRRDNGGGNLRSISARAIFAYVPSALKVILVILTVVTLFVGYRVAASASLFQVKNVDVVGASRTSAVEIETLTRRAVAKTGVWRANLSAISTELGRLPGVRHAVVTRVLPDGLRVRVTERVPVAVVRTAAGHFVWVDEDGVALGEMKPADQMPPFFIHGWSEDGTDDSAKENMERVRKYLEVVREWQAIGLTERVSELNLIDLRDVRAQLAGDDSEIEVRLGSQELGGRLKAALDVLDEYKHTPRGASITYVDVQGGRVVIGSSSGSKTAATTEQPEVESIAPATLRSDPAPAKPNPSSQRNLIGPPERANETNSNRSGHRSNNPVRDKKPQPVSVRVH